MSSPILVILLRIIHILAGIFWLGGIWVVAGFILPSIRAVGPAGGPVMKELTQVRKLPLRLLIAAWVTVLSGLALYMRAGGLAGGAWYASSMGRILGVGGALGLVVVLMGTFVNLPTARRMGAVSAQIQASGSTPELQAELQRLQARLTTLTNVAAALLAVTALAMAIARYWPN